MCSSDLDKQVIDDQICKPETVKKLKRLMQNVVEHDEGTGHGLYSENFSMAGKTGTSQIAGPGGKYEETGIGTSITSFAGYAPVDRPKFAMMVKFDRPRTLEYGSQTAAPIFKEISALLFEYYGIPPDEI